MIRVTSSILLSVALYAATSSGAPPPDPAPAAEPIRYHVCDAHLHFVDFLQHTDGMQALIKAMDSAGVDEAMISGMPLVKEWSLSEHDQAQYYLDDDARCYWYSATDVEVAREISALSGKDRKRFHPFICGFNGADRNAVEHVKRMIEWYPGLWQGIGEIMTRHDDLTALTYGDPPHANSPSLDPVYDLAAENNMPVSIHSDIASVWKREPIYSVEMENAVKKHPKTKFIWCHAGISRRINVPTVIDELRRMLNTYPNLNVDISWVVFEDYVTKDGTPDAKWVAMIEEFPDRFMIGSDIVGHFAKYPHEMQKYYKLLDVLKPETAKKISHDNFLALLPKK